MIIKNHARPLGLPIVLAALGLLSGCSGSNNSSPPPANREGTDDAGVVPAEDASVSTPTGEATVADDGSQTETNVAVVAQSVVGPTVGAPVTASNASGWWYEPAGCLSIMTNAGSKTVTYVFNGCTGPRGLAELTGTMQVTWSSSGSGSADFMYSAQNFRINRATLSNWNATAVITGDGSARSMAWMASLNGTTGDGRAFQRTNDKTVTWTVGDNCFTVSGSSAGTIGEAQLGTTFTNYQRCTGACPSAGSINVKDVQNGESVNIDYLGGGSAQVTGLSGKVVTIELACGS